MGNLFKSPSKPAPLDVNAVSGQARSQNTSNAYEQAAFNRVNQTDRFGNTLNYAQTGTDGMGNPIFSATQGLGQMGQDYARGVAGLGQKYFDAAGSRPDLGSNAAFDRAYGYASANLEPRFARAEDAARSRLANQGLDPTSEAYRSQMSDLALQQNEARNNLVTGIQGQMFNQGLQSRQQQMGELNPGLSLGGMFTQPSYASTPGVNVSNVDVAGLANQSKQQEWQGYQADVQRQNAMLGGLATIGGGLMGMPMGGGRTLGGSLMSGIGGLVAPGSGSPGAKAPQWSSWWAN